jgi:hypothetical protein
MLLYIFFFFSIVFLFFLSQTTGWLRRCETEDSLAVTFLTLRGGENECKKPVVAESISEFSS